MCFTIFIIKSEWHLYSCWPDKTSGKIVTTAKSSGRANCDTLHNARHTHTRDTIVIETPNCENPPASNSQLCSGPLASESCEWKWLTVVIIDGQLLLWGGSCYYQWLLLWHLCQAGAGAQPHLLPSHHFFTNSLPITPKNDMIWCQTVQNKFSHYLQFWLHSSWMARRHFWTRRWISNFLAGFTLAVSRWLISRARRGGGAIKMGNKRRERDEEAARVERLQEISIIRGMQAGEHADLNSHKLMHEHTFNNKKQQNIWKQRRLGRWVVPFNMWNKFRLVAS